MTVLVAGPIIFQFFGPGAVHGAPLPPQVFSGDLVGFVVPAWLLALQIPALLPLAANADFVPADFGFYLGLPMLAVLGVLGWRRWHEPNLRFFLVWTATIALLILGPTLRLVATPKGGLPLPGAILQHIPLLGDYLPVRLDLYLDLGVAILLTMLLDQLNRQRAGRNLRVLAILAVVSWLPSLLFPTEAVSTPAFFQHEQMPSKGSILVVPFARNVNSDPAMLWQVVDGFRFATPDGYSLEGATVTRTALVPLPPLSRTTYRMLSSADPHHL
jgi:hypothetical protein